MKTLDKIIKAVTCNGMRELEEERCKQIAEEYATQESEKARQEERERHAELIAGIREFLPTLHTFSAFRYEIIKGFEAAGYEIRPEDLYDE